VFEHLAELQRKSLLSTCPGRARSLKLTPQGRRLLRNTQAQGADNEEAPPTGVPLLGQVAAGAPVEAVENRDTLSLASCFGTGDDLGLQVRAA
jgi:repressor LexA